MGVKTTDIEMVSAEGRVMGEAVAVTHVDPGSPADLAGLRSGDIITHFASREVGSDRELQRMILTTGSSTPVEVKYIRGEQDNVAVIRLAGLPRRFESTGRPVDGVPKDPRPMMPQQIQRRIDSLQQELVRISRELDLLWQSAGASR